MSVFVRTLLAGEQPSIEEETFGPLETLEIRQEGLVVTHDVDVAVDRYEAIVDSAASLESLASLAHDHPTSLESLTVPFEVASSGYLKDDLSLEGISSFLRKVWDAIVKAWNAVKDAVMKLINWITGRGGKSQKDALRDAKKTLDRDDEVVVTFDVKRVKKNNDRYIKSLAEREKQYNDAAKEISANSGIDDVLDKIPTDSREEFDAYMSGDGTYVTETVSGKDYVDDVETSVKSTEAMAEQYERTIKARDNLQKTIDKNLGDVEDGNDNAMVAAFRKLQTGPEVATSKALNEAAKRNGAAVKNLSEYAEKKREYKSAKEKAGQFSQSDMVSIDDINSDPDAHWDDTYYTAVRVVDKRKTGNVREAVGVMMGGDIYPVMSNRKNRKSEFMIQDVMPGVRVRVFFDERDRKVAPKDAEYRVTDMLPGSKTFGKTFKGTLDNQKEIAHLVELETLMVFVK